MNRNKNVVEKGIKNAKRERSKKYHDKQSMNFIIFLPALLYGLIFVFKSFYDKSINISIGLAILSLFVTLCFEFNEWCGYFKWVSKVKKINKIMEKLVDINNNSRPLFNAMVIFTIIIFIFNILSIFIKVQIQVPAVLPNVITVFTLFGYFFSYALRIMIIEYNKYKYLMEENDS